jgi:hypothetical protein
MVPYRLGVSLPAPRPWFWQDMPMPPTSPHQIVSSEDERVALVG